MAKLGRSVASEGRRSRMRSTSAEGATFEGEGIVVGGRVEWFGRISGEFEISNSRRKFSQIFSTISDPRRHRKAGANDWKAERVANN